MGTLHLLSYSPFTDNRLASCLRLLKTEDAVLLMGDAVYTLQPNNSWLTRLAALPESIALFALTEDLTARNLSPAVLPRLVAVDYPEFVALTCRYPRCNSWL